VSACPCGKGESLEACCGPIIEGAPAPTAEALMRSRYTAYVLGNVEHVVRTHDPATRENVDRDAVTAWSSQSKWLGLDVVATERGGEGDTDGVVEFVAKFEMQGVAQQHHERSRFAKKDEGAGPRWFYVDGDIVKPQPRRAEAKVGRNEPCPCGSGKKYKKCHGLAA
jgi:SEC-C motif domain protein